MDTPVPNAPPAQAYAQTPLNETDAQHLKLLAIFYYIMAGLNLLATCFGLLYLAFGIVALTSPEMLEDPNNPQNASQAAGSIFGVTFTAIGGFIFIAAITMGTLQLLAGHNLRKARRRTFCFVVAILTCISSIPLGTILGVFTFIVLSRESVRHRFDQSLQA